MVVEEEGTSKTKNAKEEEASKKEEASGFRTHTHWNYLAGISCRTLQHTLQHTHYIHTMELFCWNLVCLSLQDSRSCSCLFFCLSLCERVSVSLSLFFPLSERIPLSLSLSPSDSRRNLVLLVSLTGSIFLALPFFASLSDRISLSFLGCLSQYRVAT